ncbi:uncharacterized protein TNIN_195621 [Trichonephila inaurata madagascariensis]|uniref:Chromo domain-containing protein n=1 Tax=Trichonephila inaurata madagascariensis TaxID=2747483 RepID=A0A8X6I2W2_9ARAC|nr:uncharacterized protein TNIN_195621 [Trichonephila inaurata madagascariensis]
MEETYQEPKRVASFGGVDALHRAVDGKSACRDIPVYRIKDLLEEPIQSTFYAQELQKVRQKETFPIEKVLQKRVKKGRVEYKVKYKGYPSKFDQWIPSSDLFTL